MLDYNTALCLANDVYNEVEEMWYTLQQRDIDRILRYRYEIWPIASQGNLWNCCHQMSDVKAKMGRETF